MQGTAFALEDLGIVTCDHVVFADSKAFLRDQDTKSFSLNLVKRSSDIDLAVCECYSSVSTIPFQAEYNASYHTGETLYVCGFPNYRHGDSGIRKEVRITGHRMVSGIKRILLDSGIVAGNSGGPVFNKSGRVVGIAVTGAEDDGKLDQTENISFIPIRYIREI